MSEIVREITGEITGEIATVGGAAARPDLALRTAHRGEALHAKSASETMSVSVTTTSSGEEQSGHHR